MRDKGEWDEHRVREYFGLRPNIPKIRKCLRCDRKFESAFSGNRLCYNCNVDIKSQPPKEEERNG